MKNQNITNTLTTALLALGFFGLCPTPKAFGVVPPPDGGYANFTTVEGQNALFSLTSGAANTAVGWFSLKSVTVGSFNTSVGAGTLVLNTGDANTATGTAALLLNTMGTQNTANGTATLVNNSTGSFNSAFGAFALNANVDGSDNTAVGVGALSSNTFGGGSTAVGSQALASQTGRGGSTAIGERALASQTDGEANTATGAVALENTTGSRNTAVGFAALRDSTAGDNIALGAGAGANVTTASHVICIGTDGNNLDNSCYIGQIFGATSSGGTAIFINSNGRLGTVQSSRRFKEEIKLMDKASEAILALQPVTFRYKQEIDSAGTTQFGLVAEDVEKVNPDLVVRDKEGKPYSVRYDQVNAMLLNEFLKEHKGMQELSATVVKQEATIAKQRKDLEAVAAQQQKDFRAIAAEHERKIQALTVIVKEQALQIQKVSAKVEVSEARSRTVFNNPQSD
jgi:hypothetical protein